MTQYENTNQAILRFVVLPTIFLLVAALGGLRISGETGALEFVPPPLSALILAVMLLILFVRGGALKLSSWVSGHNHLLTNVAHVLTLITLFFASAQAFNSVLPEQGLLRWMLLFFFFWTLWQNQFANFDSRRLVRSLVALFGTAFVLKHLFLASLYGSEGGWLKRVAAIALEGITLGTLDGSSYAPATGYISFFALALYVIGLILLPAEPAEPEEMSASTKLVRTSHQDLLESNIDSIEVVNEEE